MKDLKLTTIINKPVDEVFTFTLNPSNTPKWVDSIVTEQSNEWPVKLGTVYRNQRKNGEWPEYAMTAFELNKMFVLSQKNDDFNVGYSFKPLSGGVATKLEYRVWKDDGDLQESLTIEVLNSILKKLKEIVEAS